MNETIKQWAVAALVRAFKTACQTAIGVIGGAAALGGVNWPLVASSAALAAIVSILTSCAGIPEIDSGASVAQIAKTKHLQ